MEILRSRSLLSDKWLKTTASNQDFSDFVSLLDISKFVSSLQPSGTVTKESPTSLGGVPVIPLKDNGPDGGLLYAAAHGPPYIVAINGGASGDRGTIHFDQYNSATLPTAPSGAVDLNALGEPRRKRLRAIPDAAVTGSSSYEARRPSGHKISIKGSGWRPV